MRGHGYRRAESRDQTGDAFLRVKAERGLSSAVLVCALNKEGRERAPRFAEGPGVAEEALLAEGDGLRPGMSHAKGDIAAASWMPMATRTARI